jgi:hypothetical protein
VSLNSRLEINKEEEEEELRVSSGTVDVRLPGKGNSNSHGARPVHLIFTMIKWIRTSRLSINNSLSLVDLRTRLGVSVPLSSECGTYKTVKARFWPWLSGSSPLNLLSCSLFARKRPVYTGRASIAQA